ncbi:hypothetical protein HHI36_011758 [Cryptolaemus montrouzieri]|uniref:Uncharacterized protein n=1 Tax=Cryptolaemus montrouzieri TaxID=559131 RepID=A0ABD2NCS8_9CUCU
MVEKEPTGNSHTKTHTFTREICLAIKGAFGTPSIIAIEVLLSIPLLHLSLESKAWTRYRKLRMAINSPKAIVMKSSALLTKMSNILVTGTKIENYINHSLRVSDKLRVILAYILLILGRVTVKLQT